MGMKGEVIVGTGIDATKASDDDKESESTPGFLAIVSIISLISAAVVYSVLYAQDRK
jgi:hypothetical protein